LIKEVFKPSKFRIDSGTAITILTAMTKDELIQKVRESELKLLEYKKYNNIIDDIETKTKLKMLQDEIDFLNNKIKRHERHIQNVGIILDEMTKLKNVKYIK